MAVITRLGSLGGSFGQSPSALGAATIGLGLTAHLLGGGTAVDCAPILLAAVIAVVTTLAAQRLAAPAYSGAPVAVAVLGAGQFGMHLALSSHEAIDPAARSLWGLSCGLIVAHTVATALLAVLLLGANQSAELALRLLSRVWRHLPVYITLTPPSDESAHRRSVLRGQHKGCGREQRWYGVARPRRGPPVVAV